MLGRTSNQWLALFDQHKASDLTQTAFEKQHGIDPSYSSLRKRQLLAWQQNKMTFLLSLHRKVCCFTNRWSSKNAMSNYICLREPMGFGWRLYSRHFKRKCKGRNAM